MAYNPKDFYFKKAKEDRFVARSVFKLEEMDKRFKLIKGGAMVLDLGCAPGSWSQYAAKKVGHKGRVLGIDLAPVNLTIPNALFVAGDAFDETVVDQAAEAAGIAEFDMVLSDMAPKTTGIRVTDQERSLQLCYRALAVAEQRLRPGGHFVVKIFQGADSPDFVKAVKERFERTEVSRPKSVREGSFEVYVLGLGKK